MLLCGPNAYCAVSGLRNGLTSTGVKKTMTTKLTQSIVNSIQDEHPSGTQIYDRDAKGLRLVVGKRGTSYKFVGRVNDGSGRYVSVVIGRTDEISLKSARDRSAELRTQVRRGEDPRRPRRSIPNFLDAFEKYLEGRPDLRPNTVQWYRRCMDGPLKSLAKIPVENIDSMMVHDLHSKVTRTRGSYMANGCMRVVRAVLNDCARVHDSLPPNPVTRAVRMNPQRPRDWAVPPSEMPELWQRLDAMDDPVRRGCWLTMLLTGLRSNDARSMRWELLDEDGVLTVPSPKGGEHRAFKLPLSRLLLQEFEAVREYTAPLESPFVFPSVSKSGHIETMKRTEAWPHPPHSLRHSYLTFCLEAGVPLEMAKILLNHKSTDVTWGYITRANLLGPMREAAEATAAKISSFRGR